MRESAELLQSRESPGEVGHYSVVSLEAVGRTLGTEE